MQRTDGTVVKVIRIRIAIWELTPHFHIKTVGGWEIERPDIDIRQRRPKRNRSAPVKGCLHHTVYTPLDGCIGDGLITIVGQGYFDILYASAERHYRIVNGRNAGIEKQGGVNADVVERPITCSITLPLKPQLGIGLPGTDCGEVDHFVLGIGRCCIECDYLNPAGSIVGIYRAFCT